jgi:beta-lactam-binding protein with PASTA domain
VTDPDFATGSWPTQARDSVLSSQPADTLVDPAPRPLAPAPPPWSPAPERRFGAGMLLGIAAVLVALGGAAIAYFLPHRDPRSRVTTVVVRSTAPTAGGASTSATPITATKVAVPALTGRSLTEAQAALDKLGLDSVTTQVTSDQPAGTVLDQAPKPGVRLARGSAITLSIAQAAGTPTTTAPTSTASVPSQPASATVPDVSDQKEAAAVQLLNQAGILASLSFVPGSEPLGLVKAVAKPAGTTVPYHSHVQINVSIGPGDKPTEQVPNVVGQTLQQALTSINGAQLRLIYVKLAVTSRSQAGKIVQQSPLGGGHAPQNAQIVVFLGAFRG